MRSGAIMLSDSTDGLTPSALEGFFAGWPTPPDTTSHLAILEASTYVSVAWSDRGEVAGFITASVTARSPRTSRCWKSEPPSRARASARR
jgi:hypothetical protein